MASLTLLELAADRRLVAWTVRRAVGASTPEYWIEEIADEMVVRLVERHARRPDLRSNKTLARYVALDAARTATLDRPVTIGPSVDVHPIAVAPNQLDEERWQDRELDDETAEQLAEWLSKPLTVRAARARESLSALGTSPHA